ncbi:serine hydrolase, partial [Mycobacterium sp. ITM-2017-0098]
MISRAVPLVVVAVLAAAGCAESIDGTSAGPARASSAAQQAATMAAELTDRLDRAVERVMADADVPGAIVGIRGPQGEYLRAFGVADKKTRAPMKTDFYSRIGSQTKTFTVTAVLQLADQGRLGLDDPISRFVGGVPRGDEITLRHLARMQSGLPNYSRNPAFAQALYADPRREFPPRQLLDYAFAQPSAFVPGDGFEYCNTN